MELCLICSRRFCEISRTICASNPLLSEFCKKPSKLTPWSFLHITNDHRHQLVRYPRQACHHPTQWICNLFRCLQSAVILRLLLEPSSTKSPTLSRTTVLLKSRCRIQ